MKNSNDTIANETRDLPTCSAVPQPTALPCAPFNVLYILQYLHLDVQRNLFHNIHGIVIYISYYDYVLSLKMALTAKTRC